MVTTSFDHSVSLDNNAMLLEFYRQRKVFVIGADGFLGVNCINALQKFQADLTILIRQKTPRVKSFKGTVIQGDLRDAELIRTAVQNKDIIFNFAGGSSAVDSNCDPVKNLNEELCANLTLFSACAGCNTSPLVVNCSTRLVYGKPQYLPVDEKHPLNPQSIYAAHKLTAEHYLEVFRITQGLRYIILRLSNPYGPYQTNEYKGFGIINQFLQNAAHHKPIVLFGDGSQQRDYIFVDDAIRIFLMCAMNPACQGEIFNVGGSRAISISKAAELISTAAGGSPIQYVPWPEKARIIETGDYETDMSKLFRYLSLPEECSFKEGFEHTLNYYRELL